MSGIIDFARLEGGGLIGRWTVAHIRPEQQLNMLSGIVFVTGSCSGCDIVEVNFK